MPKEKIIEKKVSVKGASPLKPKKEETELAFRTVGRRKEAIARVFMREGKGAILINNKDLALYFPYSDFQKIVEAPLTLVNLRNTFDVFVRVGGGGSRGQADAIRHGITRALVKFNPELKKTLRSAGFITRDPRVKERKKPGLKRARRAPQFSKR